MTMLIGTGGAGDIDPATTTSDLARALSSSLDGLLAMGDMLARQSLSGIARDQLDAMLGSGRRMARLLDDALEARAPASEPALETVSLRELLDDVDGAWRLDQADGGENLLISCAFQPDVRVAVDAKLLRRFFNMLIEAAVESAGQGVIDVQISAAIGPDGDIQVSGRMASLRAAVASDAVKLHLCRALARHLRGDVQRGRSRGGGDHITFVLRLNQAQAETDLADASPEDGPLPPRTHLLIVDDNATNRMVAAALCGMFGCTSETAEDGLEALQAVRSRPFDLILMDIKMPRMDGLAATKAIRAMGGSAASTPIVALTANADPDAVASYLGCGMVAVVDKPIKPAQLLNALQTALSVQDDRLALQAPAA